MPQYRRPYVPGGTVFLTLVTFGRAPLFREALNVSRLRRAVAEVRKVWSFEIPGAVVLPDHAHFLWELPPNDADYSKRVGRIKVLFTQALHGTGSQPAHLSESRRRHRESDVWQRRFWDHMIRDEDDFAKHLDYIHFNPVKHGLVTCPHDWPYSSFALWVKREAYPPDWACCCDGRPVKLPDFGSIASRAGE
jgi:putative transposase